MQRKKEKILLVNVKIAETVKTEPIKKGNKVKD